MKNVSVLLKQKARRTTNGKPDQDSSRPDYCHRWSASTLSYAPTTLYRPQFPRLIAIVLPTRFPHKRTNDLYLDRERLNSCLPHAPAGSPQAPARSDCVVAHTPPDSPA